MAAFALPRPSAAGLATGSGRRSNARLTVLAGFAAVSAGVYLLAGTSDSQATGTGEFSLGFLSPPAPGGALRGTNFGMVAEGVPSSAQFRSGEPAGPTVLAAGALCVAALLGFARTSAAAATVPRSRLCAAPDGKTPLSNLKAGDKADGRVSRISKVGVWIDIGAVKEALWPKSDIPEGEADKLIVGQLLRGVEITEVQDGATPATRKIKVKVPSQPSSAPAAAPAAGKSPALTPSTGPVKVGEIFEATVEKAEKFAVFVELGSDAKKGRVDTKSLTKPSDSYAVGEKLIVKVLEDSGSGVLCEIAGGKGKPLTSFKVDQQVTGTIKSVAPNIGLFIDFGAATDAICRNTQLTKPMSTYSVGDKFTGILTSIDRDGNKVEMSMRQSASSLKVGDKIEGTVLTVTEFGVFFDAGLSNDLLGPTLQLTKALDEYKQGEVADLEVIKAERTKTGQMNITVTTKISDVRRGMDVSGKVLRVDTNTGLFLDIGEGKDAFWPLSGLQKPIAEYEVGEEVTGIMVIKVDFAKNVIEVNSPKALRAQVQAGQGTSSMTQLSDLKVGAPVQGEIRRVTNFGISVDIGAERDALWAKDQLPRPISEYKVGDKVEGLKISQVEPDKNRLAVSTKACAVDYEVGQAIESATVKAVTPFGLFLDIGAAIDALAPVALLEKSIKEYSEGETVKDLKVTDIDKIANKIAVGQRERAAAAGEGTGTRSIEDLKVGEKVEGTVSAIKEYGVFLNIGLGRKDALLPGARFGPMKDKDFRVGETIDVFIFSVNLDENKVVLSIEAPSTTSVAAAAGTIGGSDPDFLMPPGFRPIDLEFHKEYNTYFEPFPETQRWYRKKMIQEQSRDWYGNELMDPYMYNEKYPGLNAFKEFEIPLYHGCTGKYRHYWEIQPYSPLRLPVPGHLRKPDAELEEDGADYDSSDPYHWSKHTIEGLGICDKGVPLDISTKYRQFPFNNPNIYHNVDPDRVKAQKARRAAQTEREKSAQTAASVAAADADTGDADTGSAGSSTD